MSFLAPVLGGAMGLFGQQKTNQQNSSQQQQAVQNWQNAIKMMQQYMQNNPSPFGGGFNVQRPGQPSAQPFNPGGMNGSPGQPRQFMGPTPGGGGGGGRMQGGPVMAGGLPIERIMGGGGQMNGAPVMAGGLGGGQPTQQWHGGPVGYGGQQQQMPGLNPMQLQHIMQLMNGGGMNPLQRGFYGHMVQ